VGLATLYAGRGRPESEEHLILWDAQSRNQIRNRKLSYVPNRIAAAPDASRFAEGGVDKVIRIHDASTLETTSEFRAHDDSITAVAWHPHLPILGTGSADLTVRLWDLRTGKLLEEIRGSLKPPSSLRFSPSGRSLLSVSGATVRVWEPDSLGVR
jgi:WD40 repeat protein